jgi:hypothetical protein
VNGGHHLRTSGLLTVFDEESCLRDRGADIGIPNLNSSTVIRVNLPKIVSVDDHVVEPPHVWQTWLQKKYRERGPRVEHKRWGDFKLVAGPATRCRRIPRAPGATRGTTKTA